MWRLIWFMLLALLLAGCGKAQVEADEPASEGRMPGATASAVPSAATPCTFTAVVTGRPVGQTATVAPGENHGVLVTCVNRPAFVEYVPGERSSGIIGAYPFDPVGDGVWEATWTMPPTMERGIVIWIYVFVDGEPIGRAEFTVGLRSPR